jgi:FAD/FMN-containing dehydrogenase
MGVQRPLKTEAEPSTPVRSRAVLGVDDIRLMERPDLVRLWRRLFDSDPPRNASARFLRRALGYALQVQSQGDVPAKVLKALRTVADGKAPAAGSAAALRSGACLLREWNGRTYRVEVTGDGFVLDGRPYRSLSAIARKITGAHWSGPRFFGIG